MMNHFKKFCKKYLWWMSGIVFLILAIAFTSNLYVIKSASRLLYDNMNEIPFRKTALVLGTSKYFSKGNLNLFYNNRMNAAAQ